MTAKRTPSSRRPSPPPSATEARLRRWGAFLAAQAARSALGPILRMFAAVPLGMACVLLVAAWVSTPHRLVLAKQFERLTGRAQGKIVDSWMALELDPAAIGTHSDWHPFSNASYCVVVEYEGAWGAPARRAFCGTRFPINETYETPDLAEMAPRVPFAWPRDPNGIVVPEIRLSPAALQWLGSHPAGFAWPNKPPPPPALTALRLALDRPVDDIVAGWSLPVPAFPLMLDPQHPENAMPAGYVERQLDDYPGAGNWIGFVILSAMGLFVWLVTMSFIFHDTPRWAFWIIALVPLSTLPWWAEYGSRGIGRLNKQWGEVIEMMLNDLSKVDRLVVSDPANATLARGERLVWRPGEGVYADTFWRYAADLSAARTAPAQLPGAAKRAPGKPTAAPEPSKAEVNARKEALETASSAALAALTEAVNARIRATSADERTVLFTRLEQDKKNENLHTAIVYLPAAKAAIVDPRSPRGLARAARDFLWTWILTPIDDPSTNLALGERLRLSRELLDVPVPEIANMASAHWGNAKAP